MNTLEFIVWILCVYGAVNGFAFSNLLANFRNWISYSKITTDEKGNFKGDLRTNQVSKLLTKLMYCPMCLGAWVGVFMSLIWKSPSGGNIIVDFFLGSCTSWIMYLALHKLQFKGA